MVTRQVPQNLLNYHLHTAVTTDGRMTECDAGERFIYIGTHQIAFNNHLMLAQPDYAIAPASFVEH